MNFRSVPSLLLTTVIFSALSWAATERGVMVREAVLYLAPDTNSAKLANVERGREVVVLEKSGNWAHVFAGLSQRRDVTGWMLDKGIVRAATPNGDQIIYGAAADAEAEASRRHGRRGAADDALRLYSRVAEYFPQSPLAAEAAYRAADIRWQLERNEVMSRPSAKHRDPEMRGEINEDLMRTVMKKYPRTKWADLAAFHLIDNRLCGEWQGESKCPEKEAEAYEKYAAEHPQSPVVADALYDAAWRRAALIEIYKTENAAGKSADARNRALALAQRISSQYPQTDWASRARALAYMVEQNVAVYGNSVE
ncbi:MAG: hypothetical protein ACE14M_01725 [Terriglobales bacterium]